MKRYWLLGWLLACVTFSGLGCSEEKEEDPGFRCETSEDCAAHAWDYYCRSDDHKCQTNCYIGYYPDDTGRCVKVEDDQIFAEEPCKPDGSNCNANHTCLRGYDYNEVLGKCITRSCGNLGNVEYTLNGDTYESDIICADILPLRNPVAAGTGEIIHKLTKVNFPKLKYVLTGITIENDTLTSVQFPVLEKIEHSQYNTSYNGILIEDSPLLEEVRLPNLTSTPLVKIIGSQKTTEFSFPNLKEADEILIKNTQTLTSLSMPSLEKIDEAYFYSNKSLKALSFPKLREVAAFIADNNENLETVELPELETETPHQEFSIGPLVSADPNRIQLSNNPKLKEFVAPKITSVKDIYINDNELLKKIELPMLKKMTGQFNVSDNPVLDSIELPVLEKLDTFYFLNYWCSQMSSTKNYPTKVSLKSLKTADNFHFCGGTGISIPNLELVNENLSFDMTLLESLDVPKLKSVGGKFEIYYNEHLKEIHMPMLESVGSLKNEKNPLLETIEWKLKK